MKCPKCGKAGCRYNQRKPEKVKGIGKEQFIRTDFNAKCKSCGYEGQA